MQLRELFWEFDPSQTLISGENTELTVADVHTAIRRFQVARDASVLVATSDWTEAVKTLVSGQSYLTRIGICSAELAPNEIGRLLREGSFTHVLTNPEKVEALSACTPTPTATKWPELVELLECCNKRKARHNTEWLLTTSGTTGQPKLVGHDLASICRTTKLNKDTSDSIRWGMTYDFTRFAGLQVLMQSLLSGSLLVYPDLNQSLHNWLDLFIREEITHLSGTPSLWRKLLMTPGHDRLKLRSITLGGEIAQSDILDALRRTYESARIVHIYASTEAGVGFSVKDGLPGFPVSFLKATDGQIAAMRIVNGILQVRRSNAPLNYSGGGQLADAQGWIETGDMVEIIGDRVHFQGRASGLINVGGNKVQPEIIEQKLMQQGDIKLIRIYGRKNPIVGNLVVADIILKDTATDHQLAKKSILQYAKACLQEYEIPAVLNFVDDISLTTAGKVSRTP